MPTNEKLPPDGYELGPGWRVPLAHEAPRSCRGYHGCEVPGGDYLKDDDVSCADHAIAAGAIVRKAEAPTLERPCEAPFPVVASPEDLRVATERVSPRPRMPEAPTAATLQILRRQMSLAGIQPDRTPVSGDGDLFFHFDGSPKSGARASIVIHEQGEVTVEFTSQIGAGSGSFRCREVAATDDGIGGALADVAAFIAAAPPEQPSRNPLQLPPEAPAAPVGDPRLPLVVSKYPGQVFVVSDDHIWKGPPPRELEVRIAALEAELSKTKADARTLCRAWEDEQAGGHAAVMNAHAATAAAVQAERERASFYAEKAVQKRCGWRTAAAAIKNGDPAP